MRVSIVIFIKIKLTGGTCIQKLTRACKKYKKRYVSYDKRGQLVNRIVTKIAKLIRSHIWSSPCYRYVKSCNTGGDHI